MSETVSEVTVSKSASADMQAVPRALLRAARRARAIARETGTLLIIVEDGVLKELAPDDPDFDSLERTASTIHDGD